jgi:hypothetical protein
MRLRLIAAESKERDRTLEECAAALCAFPSLAYRSADAR